MLKFEFLVKKKRLFVLMLGRQWALKRNKDEFVKYETRKQSNWFQDQPYPTASITKKMRQ